LEPAQGDQVIQSEARKDAPWYAALYCRFSWASLRHQSSVGSTGNAGEGLEGARRVLFLKMNQDDHRLVNFCTVVTASASERFEKLGRGRRQSAHLF